MKEPAPIPVVAAVIERDGRFLVGRRPENKRHGGLWEFPGGKLEPGESDLEGVRRELAEELRLEAVSTGRVLFVASDQGSPFSIRFVEVVVRGEPEALEHSELSWASPAGLAELPLAPTDARFVREHLISHG